jgi:hypothetical protein
MPKTIHNISLADTVPDSMLDDPEIAALCVAFDTENTIVVNAINNVVILADIGKQSSAVTDLLAAEQQTPYYNQALPLEVRQALAAGSGLLNAIKGTKAAVEQTVKAAFGSGTVQEWFEYGGNPYCFRVLVNDFPNSAAQLAEINRAIEVSKNIRSHLDELIITVATTIANTYLASTFQLIVNVNTSMRP